MHQRAGALRQLCLKALRQNASVARARIAEAGRRGSLVSNAERT
jgi:hypothetical protein